MNHDRAIMVALKKTRLPGTSQVPILRLGMSRWNQIIAVTLVCASLGFHWLALQSAAWATMLVERSASTSFEEAFQSTFDGHHPCRLCKAVSQGAAEEQPQRGIRCSLQVDPAVAHSQEIRIIPPVVEPLNRVGIQWSSSQSLVPDVPPPRRG